MSQTNSAQARPICALRAPNRAHVAEYSRLQHPRALVEHIRIDALGLQEEHAALPARPFGLEVAELFAELRDLLVEILAERGGQGLIVGAPAVYLAIRLVQGVAWVVDRLR